MSHVTYLKVEVKLYGIGDPMVDDESSRTVLTLPITLTLVPGEEPDMMSLPDNDDCDLGVDFEFRTSSWSTLKY